MKNKYTLLRWTIVLISALLGFSASFDQWKVGSPWYLPLIILPLGYLGAIGFLIPAVKKLKEASMPREEVLPFRPFLDPLPFYYIGGLSLLVYGLSGIVSSINETMNLNYFSISSAMGLSVLLAVTTAASLKRKRAEQGGHLNSEKPGVSLH